MNPYGGGYPQQPGYPQAPGYGAPQPGYPAQPAYPQGNVSMPEPYGGGAGGALPYPAQPSGQIGFGDYGSAPPPNPGYPAAPGYQQPPAPGGFAAPPAQAGYQPPPPGGYQQPAPGGYGAAPGYGGPPPPSQAAMYGGAAQPPAAAHGYGAPPAAAPGYGAPPAAAPGYGAPAAGAPGYGAPAPQQHPGYAPGQQPPAGQYQTPPQQAAHAPHQPQAPPAGAVPTAAMAGLALNTTKTAATYKKKTEGTVKPYPNFSAERDCEVLRKAMKGLGTDEKAIIDVLANRTNEQRQEIKVLFKTMYGKDLIKDLKGELSGKFETAVVALMDKPDDYDAKECRKAIEGLGTDEDTLIEILCSRTNKQIHELKASYKKLFKKDLEKDLSGDLSGYFRRLMISLCTAGRQEDLAIDPEKAKRHAGELYSAGAKRLGTDESKFNQILCSQSFEQLQLTFDEYQKMTGKSLEQAIASEMSGDVESGMKAIVKCVRNRQKYFAEKLYKSMKGAGTNDRALIRLVVTRSEVDMVQVKQEFQHAYGKSLESFIEGDTSGDYKRLLLALVR